MNESNQENKNHFPSINHHQKPINSLLQLINLKRQEFSRHLQDTESYKIFPGIKFHTQIKRPIIFKTEEDIIHEQQDFKSNNYLTPTQQKLKKIEQLLGVHNRENDLSNCSNLLINSRKKSNELDNIGENYTNVNKSKTDNSVTHFTKKTTNRRRIQTQMVKFIKQQKYLITAQEAKRIFIGCIDLIPMVMKQRKQSNLLQPVTCLQVFNPFFARNQRIINICLLKMGKIIYRQTSNLYKIGEQLKHFYIVLLGKVKIVNGALRRVCQTGETVLQEILLSDQETKISLQRGKVIGKTFLLKLKLMEYKKMKEELIKTGYKVSIHETQTIIKRNYIIKNWLRNKVRLESNK